MTDQTLTQIQKQLDSMIALPARTYGSLMLDHMEQLWNLQYEATKAYAEAGLQCTRAALEISNPTDLQAYVENQQRLARTCSERARSDADKVRSLNQTFVLNAQKVAEDSARSMSKVAEDGAREFISAARENVKNASDAVAQKG